MTSRLFPIDLTDEEVAFGFVVTSAPTNNRTVAFANMGSGLCALKVLGRDGKTQYLICDDRLAPLYPAAHSLDELRARFSNR